jgi:hypothetical protein
MSITEGIVHMFRTLKRNYYVEYIINITNHLVAKGPGKRTIDLQAVPEKMCVYV